MNQVSLIRYLLWAYFILLIFEGALRKWLLPGMATPLLLVRDPLAIAATVLGLPYLLKNTYALFFIGLGAICVMLAVVTGHGNPYVALYGGRILILHLPLIFLFPAVFDRSDFWVFAKVTLLIVIGMVLLMGLQYTLPQSHFVNVGIGGEGSSGFSAALGRYRSSGTFAFTNGVTLFFALAATLMTGWLTSGPRPMPLWMWITLGCLLLAVPLSISRALAMSYVLIGFAFVMGGALSPRVLGRIIMGGIVCGLLLIPLSRLPIFQDSVEAFTARWEMANEAEGGGEGVTKVLEERVLKGFTEPWERLERVPMFGYGIGIGTQVGTFLYFGRRGFLLGEGEWYRVTAELGMLMSVLFLGLRIWLAGLLFLKSLAAAKAGNSLPLVCCAMPAMWLIKGGTGQPTSLGFLVVMTGLWALTFLPESTAEQQRDSEPILLSEAS